LGRFLGIPGQGRSHDFDPGWANLQIWKYPMYNILKSQWVVKFDYLLRDLDSYKCFDNVVKIQSFGNDLFDIDDHKIDHPILTNKHCQ
jgi:hypothetical protein